MEFNRGLLYHVESLEQDDTYGDYIIGRIPEAVRRQLNPKAQSNMLFVSNSELRFVMEEDAVTIVLRRLPVSGQIKSRGILEVFSGDYQGSCEISPEVIDVNETEITIRRQDWSHICRFPRNPGGFAPQVMRVLLPYDWGCCIREIRGRSGRPKRRKCRRSACCFTVHPSPTAATLPFHRGHMRFRRRGSWDTISSIWEVPAAHLWTVRWQNILQA